MTGDAYTVELAELDAVVRDLERCEREMEALTNQLERDMARLHEVWEGKSAVAQREAQLEWNQGMDEMRSALAQMRAAARQAHSNYGKVMADNVSLWEAVR